MKIVTCRHDTTTPCGVKVPAGQRVVCPETKAMMWHRAAPEAVIVSASRSWERPWYGQDLAGKSLMVTRGSGFGDALVMSGVLRAIKARHPGARIDFATDPSAAEVFGFGEPDCEAAEYFRIVPDVMPWETFRAYDWHRIVEEIIECDCEPDQTDIYQTHARFFAMPDLPNAERRPVNVVTAKARAMAQGWRQRAEVQSPLILYQVSASSPIRCQSAARVRACLAAIVSAFPAHAVVAIGGRRDAALDLPPGVRGILGQDPRITFGLLSYAAAVVCPDSMLNHVAAGMGAESPPVVSLWSSFAPADRVATYPRQHPIFWPVPCSPCRRHDYGDPPAGCPLRGWHCAGLDGIPEAAIVETLRRAIQ